MEGFTQTANGYRPESDTVLDTVPVPAAKRVRSPEPFPVTCEDCGREYLIKDARPRYRRLCKSCCGANGRKRLNELFHTPESTKSERVRANGLVNMRIRRGSMERPSACQMCGKSGKVDAHHPDYSQPDLVAFLCRSCHMLSHRDADFEKRAAKKARSTGAVSLPHANHSTKSTQAVPSAKGEA